MDKNQSEYIKTSVKYPLWATNLITSYESGSANQFILHGNVNDRLILPINNQYELGSLNDFLLKVLMPRFDVLITYDVGNGIRIEKGGNIFSEWPYMREIKELPKSPRGAIEALTRYFRYSANLAGLGRNKYQIGCLINSANLVVPPSFGLNYDLSAIAVLIKDWSSDTQLFKHSLATFLIAENLNDIHPILVNNTRAAHIKIPLPSPDELKTALLVLEPQNKIALKNYQDDLSIPAYQLAGATLNSVESLLKEKNYKKETITNDDLSQLKKQIVEKDCNGLIEFIESNKTLDDIYGQDKIKEWLIQDIELWKQNDFAAMPMGYLICGPVGTGKTFMIECLAGSAGVPVVKLKNFRDKWVGSSESNLETIFRLLDALGKCFVFIDEADQALGKRDSQSGDSGVSGRLYSMMAEKMSDTKLRGKIIWVLASSRPDLIEVDLKRPGRIDVKIPIFPTTTQEESFRLIQALCKRRGLKIETKHFSNLIDFIPIMITPGTAEALTVKAYRLSKTRNLSSYLAIKECLKDFQNPVPQDIMNFQISLALKEASDLDFVPEYFKGWLSSKEVIE
ncbi:MAG: AAA family ATPase [Armatimonadota bacterium]